MSGHHCWKWCRLKDILKFCFNNFPFQLWDEVIRSTSGPGHRTKPWPSKLVFLHFGDANKALSVHLLDSLMWLAHMSPTCPHPHTWKEYSSAGKGSAVMCSSLVILLWLKMPSAHKVLPLWSLLIFGLGKAWNWLRAWHTQGNLVTMVLHAISFSFGLADGFPKFQCEFQKPVGGAEWKVMERTRTLMRNWKCAELKLIYTQGPSDMQAWKKYIHTMMNKPTLN